MKTRYVKLEGDNLAHMGKVYREIEAIGNAMKPISDRIKEDSATLNGMVAQCSQLTQSTVDEFKRRLGVDQNHGLTLDVTYLESHGDAFVTVIEPETDEERLKLAKVGGRA